MKKILITSTVAMFALFFVGSASACVLGCDPNDATFNVKTFGGFVTNNNTWSEAGGAGDLINTEVFTKNQEGHIIETDIVSTTFGPGSPCDATCAENKATVHFSGFQSSEGGALSVVSSEGSPSSSYTHTGSNASFAAGAGSQWSMPVINP